MSDPADPFAIFDPWGAAAGGTARRRWSPVHPRRPSAPPPDPARDPRRFLAVVAVREARAVAARVERAGHFAVVQDLTDLTEAAVRLLLWPRPDLLARDDPRTLATLAVRLRGEGRHDVIARHWVGAEPERTLAAVRVRALDAGWIRKVLLDFVEESLSSAERPARA